MGPFWDLIAKADNIPIVLMGPLFALALGYSLVAARRNDRRLAEGGEGAVKRAMDGPPLRSGEDLPGAKVHTWPHLLKIELVGGLILLLILIVWSIVIDAPLEQEADPSRTPNPSKAPWYFLGLQEMLVYFDPWIAGVALPTLIILGLAAIPYLDLNPRGSGYLGLKDRWLAISLFLFGLFGLWLPLIFVGTFCRGPGWGWFWPWERWDVTAVVEHPTRNLAELFGVTGAGAGSLVGAAILIAYYGIGFWGTFRWRKRALPRRLGGWRTATVAFLGLSMLGLPIKIALRLLWSVKYVFTSPWLNV